MLLNKSEPIPLVGVDMFVGHMRGIFRIQTAKFDESVYFLLTQR